MNTFVVFAGFLALAAGRPNAPLVAVGAPLNLAPTLVRAPAHDSASIESHRLGGNFAYAVAEAHAYAQVTPQVSTITHPVAETTVVHEPATIAKVTPGQVITTKHIPAPVIAHQPILKSEPVIQAKTTYTRPLYKTRTYTQHIAQPVAQTVAVAAAPVVEAAPVAVAAGPAFAYGAHGAYAAGPGFAYGAAPAAIGHLAAPA